MRGNMQIALKAVFPVNINWIEKVKNDADLLRILNHPDSVYSNTAISFFRFSRNAAHHFTGDGSTGVPGNVFKAKLDKVWPNFVEGLHFALVACQVEIGTRRGNCKVNLDKMV